MLNIYPTHMLWLKVMPGGNKSGVCPVWHCVPASGDSSWLGGPDYSSLLQPTISGTNHQDLDDNEEKEKSTKIIILTENVCFSFNEVLISEHSWHLMKPYKCYHAQGMFLRLTVPQPQRCKFPNFWQPSIFWLPPSPSGVHSHQAAQLHQERMWVEPFLAAGSCRKRCGLRVHGVPATLNGKQNG